MLRTMLFGKCHPSQGDSFPRQSVPPSGQMVVYEHWGSSENCITKDIFGPFKGNKGRWEMVGETESAPDDAVLTWGVLKKG